MSNLATSVKEATPPPHDAPSGPRLIFAGTRQGSTLLERAIDLIENHGADPESLLVVTPTDKTAHELTTRLRNKLNALGIKFNPNVMYAGTFLSLCLRVLEENREHTRLKRNYTVMDSFDQHYFLYQRLDDYLALNNSGLIVGRAGTHWSQAQTLLKRLNAVSEQALDSKRPSAATPEEGRALAACYRMYRQHLEKANALDASTAQLAALRLLENNRSVLADLKRQLAYLIVDVRQETSVIKERILGCFVDLRSLPCLAGNEQAIRSRPEDGAADASGENVVEFRQPAGERGKATGRPTPNDTVPWWLL